MVEFHIGLKVFGKIKGFPYWPGVIEDIKNDKYLIRFYGDEKW